MTVQPVLIAARDYYLSHGEAPLPLNGAIALAAVLYYESRLNPGSQGFQATETPGVLNPHGAFGIASWNGPRQQDLANFATKHSLKVDALETQLAFVLTEIADSYPACWAAIRSSASIQAIIESVVDEYEVPAGKPREIRGALAFAEELATAPLPQAPGPFPSVPAPTMPAPQTPMPAPPAGLPPISATSAARIAAAINQLHEMREMRIVELIADDPEIKAIDASLAAFEAFQGLPTASVPSPPASSAATTQGHTMPSFITGIFTNWLTSTFGTVAGVPAIVDIINSGAGANWKQDIPQLATMVLGWIAKDFPVTGGTKPATPEAKQRVGK